MLHIICTVPANPTLTVAAALPAPAVGSDASGAPNSERSTPTSKGAAMQPRPPGSHAFLAHSFSRTSFILTDNSGALSGGTMSNLTEQLRGMKGYDGGAAPAVTAAATAAAAGPGQGLASAKPRPSRSKTLSALMSTKSLALSQTLLRESDITMTGGAAEAELIYAAARTNAANKPGGTAQATVNAVGTGGSARPGTPAIGQPPSFSLSVGTDNHPNLICVAASEQLLQRRAPGPERTAASLAMFMRRLPERRASCFSFLPSLHESSNQPGTTGTPPTIATFGASPLALTPRPPQSTGSSSSGQVDSAALVATSPLQLGSDAAATASAGGVLGSSPPSGSGPLSGSPRRTLSRRASALQLLPGYSQQQQHGNDSPLHALGAEQTSGPIGTGATGGGALALRPSLSSSLQAPASERSMTPSGGEKQLERSGSPSLSRSGTLAASSRSRSKLCMAGAPAGMSAVTSSVQLRVGMAAATSGSDAALDNGSQRADGPIALPMRSPSRRAQDMMSLLAAAAAACDSTGEQ